MSLSVIWNLSPSVLCSSGFVGWVGGVVRASDKSTFVLGDSASIIDYFVIAQELEPSAGEVTVDLGDPGPHRVVSLAECVFNRDRSQSRSQLGRASLLLSSLSPGCRLSANLLLSPRNLGRSNN